MWLYDWFSVRRGLAGGIIFAGQHFRPATRDPRINNITGTGVGGFAFPLILGAMLDKVGYGWTMRIWALITLLASGVAMIGLKPRLPLPPKGSMRAPLIPRGVTFWREPVFTLVVRSSPRAIARGPMSRAQLLTSFIQSLGYLSVSLYLSVFTTSLGYSPLYGQIALALFK